MELSYNEKVILENLFYDARLSTRQLANLLKIKQPSVQNIIKKLESKGCIRQYDALLNIHMIPLKHKIYFINLNKDLALEITKLPECIGLLKTYNYFEYCIIIAYKNESFLKDFEKKLSDNKLSFELDKSHRIGNSFFNTKQRIEKYSKNERHFKLDNIDSKILKILINGGARKTLTQIALDLNLSIEVVKYRKKKLIENGYLLYFTAQPGNAFVSLKVIYHSFILNSNFNVDLLKHISGMSIAYTGENTLLVIQVCNSFNDYLMHSEELFQVLKDIVISTNSFFIKEEILLNDYDEKLFYESSYN